MEFKFAHFNFNVMNIEISKKFYAEALGFKEMRKIDGDGFGGGFQIVYLSNNKSPFELELTELKDHPQKYDLGEGEFHLAVYVDDYEAAFKKHTEMGCVCLVNEAMGIYFIEDPDGYWIEILPQ